MPKIYRYALTFFQEPVVPFDDKRFIYFISGKELAPSTNKPHWQAYLEVRDIRSLQKLKRFLQDNTVHIERIKKSTLANIFYCCKNGKVSQCFGNPSDLTYCPPVKRSQLKLLRKRKLKLTQHAENKVPKKKLQVEGETSPSKEKKEQVD